MMWQKERLPVNMETLTRAALLRASGFYSSPRPTLILDPDLRAEKWLQVLLCTRDQERGKASHSHGVGPWPIVELCVIDASHTDVTQRLLSAREQGLCVLIRNVEKMPSCLETILQCRQGNQFHPVPSSKRREAPCSSNDGSTQNPSPPVVPSVTPVLLPLFLSTSLPLNIFVQEVGASFLKDVTLVDLSLGPSGLEELLVQEMVRFKDPRLQEESRRLSWNALKLMEELGSAQDELLDYISSGTSPLVEDKDFLNVVSTCEEAQATLRPSMQDVEILQRQLQAPMTPYVSAAQSCVHLFSRLQEVSRLSLHYHFPVSSILNWALSALHGQTESDQEVEKVLTRGVLTRVLPMIAEEHRHVLHVLLAVGRPHPLEWFSFLGLRCKSVFETLSSCIQRPQWVDVQAWEALAQLEKLSAFQGIRSSLSAQAKQWQEYFSLRSTVIGPIPCSSFSHLTLFQAAILWRILKPECLGLVLSHLSSCTLGPEPEDRCQDGDVISQSDPHTPVLFIRPPVSPDLPTCYILHLAQKKGMEVKMLSWSKTLSISTMTDTLLTSQREGHWLLLNWHPRLADILLIVKADEVNPDFRLCVAVDEEMMSSLPVALGFGSCSAPCVVRLTLRDVLLQSCLDVAEDLGEQNTLPLKLLILHSVLVLRQEYSPHVQRRTYCWGEKDLRNALCAVRTVMAQCRDWREALPFITGAVIYGGHIVEEDDAQTVMAVVQHCLQESHQRGSRGLSHMMSALAAGGVNGPWLSGVTWSLQKLLSMRDPAVLGLSEGLKNVTTELYGYRLFSDLLITQDVWTFHPCRAIQDCSTGCGDSRRRTTSSGSSSPRSPVVHDTSQCLDLLLELGNKQQRTERELDPGLLLDALQVPGLDASGTLSSRANTKTTSAEWPKEGNKKRRPSATHEEVDRWSKPRPMLRFLLHEWKLLHTLIQGATQEARDAESSCLCQKCQEMRETLSEGHVPPGWNVYSETSPVTLQAWIQGLHLRFKLLSTYISQPSPFNVTYNVSVFRQPSGLLHSLLQEQALEDHRELESYGLHMQVSGRTSPSLQPVGISLVGIHLRHALWDTRLELLQETLSPQLCALPSVHISAVPQASNAKCHHPAQSYYLCPLYTGEGPRGHKQHQEKPLLLIPIPTTVSPFLWRQRRVHALSLL